MLRRLHLLVSACILASGVAAVMGERRGEVPPDPRSEVPPNPPNAPANNRVAEPEDNLNLDASLKTLLPGSAKEDPQHRSRFFTALASLALRHGRKAEE